MNKEEIATTYKEYKNGFKLVAGLGRLNCYQGLDYLFEILEKDKFYSEELEDTIVFIESHINRIEKENQKYKELFEKIFNYLEDNYGYSCVKGIINDTDVSKLYDILKEVE